MFHTHRWNCYLHKSLSGRTRCTGGLSLIGPITATIQTATPEWVVIHVVDNERVPELVDTNLVSAFRSVLPFLWSPAWYAHHNLSRPVLTLRQEPTAYERNR